MSQIELLATVALLRDLPQHGLLRGQVGTVVEMLSPETFEVEFSDDQGTTYALVPLRDEDLIQLHHSPVVRVA